MGRRGGKVGRKGAGDGTPVGAIVGWLVDNSGPASPFEMEGESLGEPNTTLEGYMLGFPDKDCGLEGRTDGTALGTTLGTLDGWFEGL